MMAPVKPDAVAPQRERISELTDRISKLADMAMQVDKPRPFLEKIRAAEQEREELLLQIAGTDVEQNASETLQSISEADVRAILAGLVEQFEEADREGLKDFLAGLVERIDLTADGSQCVIHYRISTGDKVASPRGFEPRLPP